MNTTKDMEQYMSLKADVEALKKAPLPSVRKKIAAEVSSYYKKEIFDDTERAVACDIIRMLARDVELKVRQTISENIKESKDIPHDVALTLANDVLEVSLPILEFSTVLNDEDLVGIIRSTKQVAPLIAISKRNNASEIVSGELINTSNEDVVVSLFSNETAKISQGSLEFAFNEFKNNGKVVNALINRTDLSIVVVEKILNAVSEDLREELIKTHKVNEKQSNSIVNESREKAIVNLLNAIQHSPTTEDADLEQEKIDNNKAQIEELVSSLSLEGRLTESLIIRSICEGNLLFFEISLSVRAGIPLDNTRILLQDGNPEALHSLWKRAKMPESTFDAINIIINFAVAHFKEFTTSADYGQHILEYIQDNSYDKTIPLMPYMMSLISSGLSVKNVI